MLHHLQTAVGKNNKTSNLLTFCAVSNERERLTGAKILNCMESGGVEEPGRRQLQEVEVVKTVVQERRKRRKVLNTALRKKVKNLSGVTTKT